MSIGNRESASASLFECPGLYLIVKEKSASYGTQRWPVALNLAVESMYVRGLLSVSMTKWGAW